MVFTRRFWWLLGGGVVLGLLGFADAVFLTAMVLFDVAIFGLALGSLLLAPRRDGFQAVRRHDPVLSVRADNLIRVSVTYRGPRTIAARLRDEPPQEFETQRREFDLLLHPGRAKEVRYHSRPPNRGEFEFRELFLKVPAPLGLAQRIHRLPVRSSVSVYPNLLALRKYDLLRHRGHLREIGIRRASLKGVGSEFESLREYIPGDEMRKVDWKATARRSKLIVRQYQAERSQSVILALDLGRLMMAEVEGIRKYDHVIDAALMLANAAVRSQDRVGLLVYHDLVVRFVPPRRGAAQIGVLLDALHGLEPEPVESDPKRAFNYLARRWRKRSLVMVFTDLIELEASADVLSSLRALRRGHLCVAATVADPMMDSLASRTVDAPSDLYRRAVALQVLDDRRQAVRELELAGVRVIDAEPQRLAQALINHYTRIKARGEL